MGAGSLAHLPRSGVLHVVQTTAPVGWSAAAALPADAEPCVLIGAEGRAPVASLVRGCVPRVIVPPLGIASLAARRLRDWVRSRGVLPREVHCHGPAVAPLVRRALGEVACAVSAQPAVGFALRCSESAASLFARCTDQARADGTDVRASVREDLGLAESTGVIIAIGDRPSAIDAAEAFAAVGRAVLAGADLVLMVPASARWVTETQRHARRLRMEDRLIVSETCGTPSAIWRAADIALLQRPVAGVPLTWWGYCGWWALAAGADLVHASCFRGAGAAGCYAPDDRLALVRWLVAWSDSRCAVG
ncbi:MAG: hypothetical protein FJ256_00725 [Phycisphaerae bacterium]|nr:hypothetical protein [Phycisphaerae bacterium]